MSDSNINAIEENLGILSRLQKENEEIMARLMEIEKISNTILKGLDEGIPTVEHSFPHKKLIFYFDKYRYKQYEEMRGGE